MVSDLFDEINSYLIDYRKSRSSDLKNKIEFNINRLVSQCGLSGYHVLKKILEFNIGFEYTTTELILGTKIDKEESINNLKLVGINGDVTILDDCMKELDGKLRIAELLKTLADKNNMDFKNLIWVIAYSITCTDKLSYDCVLSELYNLTSDLEVIDCVYSAMKWCCLNKDYLNSNYSLLKSA